MPRLVPSDRDGPIRINPQDKPVFICGCGLTRTFPFCDGSHKACKGEDLNKLYVYDSDGGAIKRREIGDPKAP